MNKTLVCVLIAATVSGCSTAPKTPVSFTPMEDHCAKWFKESNTFGAYNLSTQKYKEISPANFAPCKGYGMFNKNRA
jgi:hypothetical protein